MNVIDSVRKFIKTCPYLEEYNGAIKVGVDMLEKDATTYSIEEVPVNPILKRYVNGSSLRQFVFVFASREIYGEDVKQNIENVGFYEEFSDWLDKCTKEGNLPILDTGKEATKIVALTNGYLYNEETTTAKYTIQCKLEYIRKEVD